MKLWRLRLRTKLILAFAIVLLPVLALLLVGFEAGVKQGIKNTLNAQLMTADAVAVQVDELFAAVKGVGWAVANDPTVQRMDRGQLDAHLRQLLVAHPLYEAIGVFDARGNQRGWGQLSRPGMSQLGVGDGASLQAALATNSPTISDVIKTGKGADEYGIVAAVPIRDGNGRAVGVVAVLMDTDELAKRYEESRLRPGQAILLWDRRGCLAFHSSLRSLSPEARLADQDTPAVRQAISGSATTVEAYRSRLLGGMRLGAFVPTKEYRWAVGVTMSRSVALAPVRATLQKQLVGLGLILGLSAALGLWVARRLLLPVQRLQEQAQTLGHGDLSRRVRIRSGDELGELGAAFNEMASRLQERDAALRESEERFRATFEQAAVGIGLMDLCGRWMRVNDKLCDIVGYSHEELLGKTHLEITHPDDVEMSRECVARVLGGGTGTCMREKRYTRKDGLGVWVNLTVSAVWTAERKAKYLIAVVEDITERKRAQEDRDRLLTREQAAREQAEAANRAKDQFIAVVSHELRTPLTPVLTTVELLKQDPKLSAETQADLEVIKRNVQMESRLIDDLLDLTRASQAKIPIHREAVDVHGLIGDIGAMFRKDSETKGVALCLDLQAERHRVYGDPGRLRQVLWNLVGNAMKFTPAGGRITVSSCNEDSLLRVQVKDTGIGIEPAVMERLFRPFEQGEQSRSRRYGGLGLGLSISKSLVEMHGGTVSVASEGKGKGAVFTVELPILTDVQAELPQAPLASVAGPRKAVKILLVEDNEDTLRVMGRLLEHLGHQVKTARSAKEAVEAAGEEGFDLLISDVGLPDATGWELMQQLRAVGPIRGIAISGYGTPDDLEQSRRAGFAEHMTKPINVQKLEEVIEAVVSGSEHEARRREGTEAQREGERV
ncbi:MAG: PAS domain S-box protein [Bacillota bacterium]